jgi:signal peptidase I
MFGTETFSRLRPRHIVIQGSSMSPAFTAGEHCLSLPYSLWRKPKRGDCVVALDPRTRRRIVKRISFLPGERFQLANGQAAICGDREYGLFGDNASESTDSRAYGPIPRTDILGYIVSPNR